MVGLRNAKSLEHFNDFVDSEIKTCAAPYPEVIDGYFALPPGPGWGVELNEAFLEGCHAERQDGILCDPGLNMFVNADWNRRSQPSQAP